MTRLPHPAAMPPTLDEVLNDRPRLFVPTQQPNAGGEERQLPRPVGSDDRSRNPLRPATFAEVIGQEKAVTMMQRVVATTLKRGEPLDHVLLVGPAGTGKSTFSHVIANELHAAVYEVEAPVSFETLLDLRHVMRDRDMLRIEEIHQQAVMERRGRTTNTQPEVLYALMEDFVITTETGLLPFPRITIVGTTTDEGMLPDPFLARFPLRPHLEAYSATDLGIMAIWNAERLGLKIEIDAAWAFAQASRGVPRQVNNYVRNAAMLTDGIVTQEVADEVLHDLNGVTSDGLTRDMQNMLAFLFEKGKRTMANGDVVYQASVNTIATAIGKSRDSKAIALRVEPYLIEQGFVQVRHGGRALTDAGVARAKELIAE